MVRKLLPEPVWPTAALISDSVALSRSSRPQTSVSHGVPVYSPAYAALPNYTVCWQMQMHVVNLSKVALDSAAAGIEPAISNRKSNALTTAPPSHSLYRNRRLTNFLRRLCQTPSKRLTGHPSYGGTNRDASQKFKGRGLKSGSTNKYTKFVPLIVRKIIKIIATRCILR